jgi:hypothetical protein
VDNRAVKEDKYMQKTPSSQLENVARYRKKIQAEGNKNVQVVLPPDLYNFVQHLRTTNPGGFNFSEFVKQSLKNLASGTGYKL